MTDIQTGSKYLSKYKYRSRAQIKPTTAGRSGAFTHQSYMYVKLKLIRVDRTLGLGQSHIANLLSKHKEFAWERTECLSSTYMYFYCSSDS